AFSIGRQAMQLGYIPRMRIKHTSSEAIGQIYVPGINWMLMVMVIGLVLVFRSSSNLAVAYGISVSATMLIDTLLLALVARALWPARRLRPRAQRGRIIVVAAAFVVAERARLLPGAWFRVVGGRVLFTVMRTGRRVRGPLREEIRRCGIRVGT